MQSLPRNEHRESIWNNNYKIYFYVVTEIQNIQLEVVQILSALLIT